MAEQTPLSDFFKKLLAQRNTKIIKNVMASLHCHGDSDDNKTQIIRNFHLYIIQLGQSLFHIFTHDDVVSAQIWEVSPSKNPFESPKVSLVNLFVTCLSQL